MPALIRVVLTPLAAAGAILLPAAGPAAAYDAGGRCPTTGTGMAVWSWRSPGCASAHAGLRPYGRPLAPAGSSAGSEQRSHRVPAEVARLDWAALARCESGGNPRAVNPRGFYGLYQFSAKTWRSVGGAGLPHHATGDEQTYRAQRLYSRGGARSWPTCGHLLHR